MPIFELDLEDLRFPSPELAEPDGCLAIGGDFRPMRMISAYASGIFPWMTWQGRPVWYSPDPRMVLEPATLHVPRSLAKIIRRGDFEVRLDSALAEVVEACRRTKRPGQRGSWITKAYTRGVLELASFGVVHSAEAWRDGQLVGGLYGLSLGRVFFGESMFAEAPDASKVAFAALTHALWRGGWRLIDCQQETSHLARFGATPWPRARYLEALGRLVADEPEAPPWGAPLPPWDGRMPGEGGESEGRGH